MTLGAGGDRIQVHEWRDEESGALSDFLLLQETRVGCDGQWLPVARIDTFHNSVHMHLFDSNGIEISYRVVREYTSREELEAIWRDVDQYMLERWEDNHRRHNEPR